MAAEYIGIIIKAGATIIKFLPRFFIKIWNYICRPKIRLAIRYTHIEFTDFESKRVLPSFPAIRVHNAEPKDLTLDFGRFYVNGESLSYIIQQNIYFCRTLDQTVREKKLDTNNELFTLFREKFISKTFLKLPAHQHIDIPLYPQRMGESTWFRSIDKAKVFFPERKIVVRIGVDSGEYDFAINRMDFLKIIFSFLVNEINH